VAAPAWRQWRYGDPPADHVQRRAQLAAAGGTGACRRARIDGAGRGEVAGMNMLEWNALDAEAQRRALPRPVQAVAAQTRETVAALIAQVRAAGDDALRQISARFDGIAPESFEVSAAAFAAAARAAPAELRMAMQAAPAR